MITKTEDKLFWKELLDKSIVEPAVQKISVWAENNRFLSAKVTAKQGMFSWDNAPYWKEVCDNFSPSSPIRETAIMKGTQVGCTTSVYENILGYNIGIKATSTVFVSADKQLLKDFKKIKINQLLDDSSLRQYVKSDTGNNQTRNTGDTQSLIEYDNGKQGFIRLCGSHNKNDFQSIHFQQALIDEVDSFHDNVQGDGDICALIDQRTATFKDKAKIGYMSRPSLAHKSIIKQKYENGDQRKWYVPCPHCYEQQVLIFHERDGGEYEDSKGIIKETENGNKILFKPYGIMFDSIQCKKGNYSSVVYRCKHCGEEFDDSFQHEMNKHGEWRPTTKTKYENYRSYHFNGIYVKSWRLVVRHFLEAGKDPNKLQVFYNSVLGLPFEDTTAGVDISIVHNKRKDYPNNLLQNGTLFLVASADVQDDRLECEIKAYGDRMRSWGVDHRIFKGKTSDPQDQCWKDLASVIDEEWQLPNGKKILVERLAVDSGDGEKTDMIYDFCEKYGGEERAIIPLKGMVSTLKTREKFKIAEMKGRGIALFEIYVDLYKNQVSKYLNQEWREGEEYPDGYIDFPATYSDEYLRQLTTEKKHKEKTAGGFTKFKWVQHGRNESFDLNVYCLALAEMTIWQISVDELGLEISSPLDVFGYLKNQ